ncbi:hypothetical protein A2160_05470 [Candidatus Beckwithbacteria bacterium RBG_13_42_9]|uniref:Fibronectin type-III domain-containing protein n=1 Tax=Candidatus Beckwithbacteria bacterium RBG_13_42_9 TaxID=1797457 RepID=A0A1F5E767_9BACT|nr:MAG: hypothetical protein A2160_05470 [Candidatus Beckwithbacteria bacterium RBG_13_42_9]
MMPVPDDSNLSNQLPSDSNSSVSNSLNDDNQDKPDTKSSEPLEGFLNPATPASSNDADLPSLDLPDDTVQPGSISDNVTGGPNSDNQTPPVTPSQTPSQPAEETTPIISDPTLDTTTLDASLPGSSTPPAIEPEPEIPVVSQEATNSPVSPPQATTLPEPELKPAVPPPQGLKKSDRIMLTAGPLFLIASLGLAALVINFRRPTTNVPVQFPAETLKKAQENTVKVGSMTITKDLKNKWDLWLENIPQNPNQTKAICQSTGVTLISEQPSDCPEPKFSFSGAEAKEPGTQIEGYYIYFGENNNTTPFPEGGSDKAVSPRKMGTFQAETDFIPQNLEKGKTYYLFVQTVTNSNNENYKFGADIVDKAQYSTRPANILFTYIYE